MQRILVGGEYRLKKVLFLIESLSGGGAEKVLTDIIRNIDKKKFNITVMTVVKTGVYIEEISKYCQVLSMLPAYEKCISSIDKIRYRMLYKYIYAANPKKIYKKFICEQYDVEIAFVEGFATKLIAFSSNKSSKKIAWIHIDMEKNPYADQYFLSIDEERKIYDTYNSIVAVSKSVKNSFQKKFQVTVPVEVIYNPIDSINIIKKANKKNNIQRKAKLQVISVGRLEEQKGYDRLIKAFSKINHSKVDVHLWILGDGGMKTKLKKMIEAYNLEKKVSLLGFQNNPYIWMKKSDVFFCSSRAEGYSLVIAEAMTLGIPIISVDCAGPNELLGFGKYGMLIQNTDYAITEAMLQLVNQEIDLEYYSALSSERKSFFELESTIKRIEELIDAK